MVMTKFLHVLSDAEKQLALFEEKVAGQTGWINNTVNYLSDLQSTAQELAAKGKKEDVHQLYSEASLFWKLLRGIESAIRKIYPHLCLILDLLVYIYQIGSGNHWEAAAMTSRVVLDSWPYIQDFINKLHKERN